jgi:hypothetical protein
MDGVSVVEAIVGGLLVFFVPGYALTRATFPEWRLGGPAGSLRLLEIVALAFVLSVVLTVLVGYVLLAAGPTGFQAAWSDPVVEATLAGVALVAFVAGWFRGAYRSSPPARAATTDADREAEPFELLHRLDLLAREERRLRHRLRTRGADHAEQQQIERQLEELRIEVTELRRRREAEYAE